MRCHTTFFGDLELGLVSDAVIVNYFRSISMALHHENTKFSLLVIRFALVVLVFAFLAASVNAQESSPKETSPTKSKMSIGTACLQNRP